MAADTSTLVFACHPGVFAAIVTGAADTDTDTPARAAVVAHLAAATGVFRRRLDRGCQRYSNETRVVDRFQLSARQARDRQCDLGRVGRRLASAFSHTPSLFFFFSFPVSETRDPRRTRLDPFVDRQSINCFRNFTVLCARAGGRHAQTRTAAPIRGNGRRSGPTGGGGGIFISTTRTEPRRPEERRSRRAQRSSPTRRPLGCLATTCASRNHTLRLGHRRT